MFEQEGTDETEIEKCAVSRELRAVVARKCAAAVGRLSAPLRVAGNREAVGIGLHLILVSG
jgi:hypothetical protein